MTVTEPTPLRQTAPAPDNTPHGVGPRGVKAPVQSVVTGPPNASNRINGLFQSYERLGYSLPFELLDHIELLATYNPDYSQAVENIKTLANSGHELFVNAKSELQQRRAKELLEEKARTIQQAHGGIDGVIDKLLDQAATFGAMCGEWVLSEDLDDVIEFADINPKHIRFFWEEDVQRYCPYQKVSHDQAKQAERNGQKVIGTCVKLNELTFHYFAFDAMPGSPYGTPPFLAALGNIAIQADMVHNMSQIVKKIGLLGMIDVVIKQLPRSPGESDNDYAARATSLLDEYGQAVEDMVSGGGMVHYDDVEVNTTNLGGNAAGATNIFKQNEELIFSGLKSMPSVQGRSYSTTETYAGVAYDIIIRNTKKYQKACKRMIEAGYWLMATMRGLNPETISLNFKENKTLHRLQDAQSEAVELRNALVMWAIGLVDQAWVAQRFGINSPARPMAEPPESRIIGNAGNVATGDQGGDPSASRDEPPRRSDESAADDELVERVTPIIEGFLAEFVRSPV